MGTSQQSEWLLDVRRKAYVFLAVSLAVFLLAITSVGIACKGYAFSGDDESSSISQTQLSAEQATANLAKANEELKLAAQDTIAALTQCENANAQLTAAAKSRIDAVEAMRQGPQDPPAETPAPTSGPQMVANPRWTEMHDALEKLLARRAELLITMLPTHPAVQAVQSAISEAEGQLQSIPKEIPGQQSAPISRPPTAQPNPSRESSILLNEAIQNADAEFRKRSDELTAAKQKYEAAKERELAANQRQHAAEVEHVTAAGAAANNRGSASVAATIYLSGLCSIAIGLAIALFARVKETTFRSAAEVRQKLGLTVLGFMSRGQGEAPQEKPRREPRWVSRSVLAAELVVAASIVCLIAAAIFDHNFIHSLLENPLAACSQKFWC